MAVLPERAFLNLFFILFIGVLLSLVMMIPMYLLVRSNRKRREGWYEYGN